MDYTITTSPDQDVVLGIAAKGNNQIPQDALNDLVTAALLTLEARQREGFLNTIAANDGVQTLETLANTAATQPSPNTTTP